MGNILSRIDILGIEEEMASKKETEKLQLVHEGKRKDLGKVECNKEDAVARKANKKEDAAAVSTEPRKRSRHASDIDVPEKEEGRFHIKKSRLEPFSSSTLLKHKEEREKRRREREAEARRWKERERDIKKVVRREFAEEWGRRERLMKEKEREIAWRMKELERREREVCRKDWEDKERAIMEETREDLERAEWEQWRRN